MFMEKYYLAIDIGASSGRHILGSLEGGKLTEEEIYRFENGATKKDGKLLWDTEALFSHILEGIKTCKKIGKIPASVGIDTWGVDYVLLDKDDKEIMPVYCYRDESTLKYIDTVVPFEEMYKTTGMAYQPFNTVYQLLRDKAEGRLDNAVDMLMIPEYFSFLLTGNKQHEYTEASTSGLLNAITRDWDYDLIEKLGLPKGLFRSVVQPGYSLGKFKPEIEKEVGFSAEVLLVPSHDTASAVAAVPAEDALYISSGTWSLLGIEDDPVLTDEARLAGYTNEGGMFGKTRFLKNIMGLWVIQQLRHEDNDRYSFAEIVNLAKAETDYKAIVDINKPCFFSPKSMTETLIEECRAAGQPIPDNMGKRAKCVYESLAVCYDKAIKQLTAITGKTFDKLHIIGGGCKNQYLNELTAKATGLTVISGPEEATSIGNLLIQIMADNKGMTYKDAKNIVKKSFSIKEIKNV